MDKKSIQKLYFRLKMLIMKRTIVIMIIKKEIKNPNNKRFKLLREQ